MRARTGCSYRFVVFAVEAPETSSPESSPLVLRCKAYLAYTLSIDGSNAAARV